MAYDVFFRQLFDPPSSTYTYLLADPDTREAVYIDTVFEQHFRDLALLEELDLTLVAVLDTHCHADHVTGAWRMKQATGCRIGVSRRYGEALSEADILLDHGSRIDFGRRHLDALATPGHTVGCLTFVTGDRAMAFTGDSLMIRGAGRCDFQQGNAATLFRSITGQIFALPDACLVYPGHDYQGRTMSSVGEERRHNARLGQGADERDFVGFMANLHLPHPRKIDIAVPANLRCGRPPDGRPLQVADWGPVRQSYAGLLEIDAEWVAEHLDEVLVVDVRGHAEIGEFGGRIANALEIPLDQLTGRVSEIPRDRPIIAVCHSGMRSGQATVILRDAGIARVANLKGGMLLWREMGLPLVR